MTVCIPTFTQAGLAEAIDHPDCLKAIAAVGGPRCCKRDGRLSIECAAGFSKERFGIDMPVSRPACTFSEKNRECLDKRCPYHG